MPDNPQIGGIGWIDMTVDDADGLRDFYQGVVGWEAEPVSMGDYSDYSMIVPGSGHVLVEPKGLAGGSFCVIRDPSGAVAALYQP